MATEAATTEATAPAATEAAAPADPTINANYKQRANRVKAIIDWWRLLWATGETFQLRIKRSQLRSHFDRAEMVRLAGRPAEYEPILGGLFIKLLKEVIGKKDGEVKRREQGGEAAHWWEIDAARYCPQDLKATWQAEVQRRRLAEAEARRQRLAREEAERKEREVLARQTKLRRRRQRSCDRRSLRRSGRGTNRRRGRAECLTTHPHPMRTMRSTLTTSECVRRWGSSRLNATDDTAAALHGSLEQGLWCRGGF